MDNVIENVIVEPSKILDEAVFVSLCIDAMVKNINLSILSPAIDWVD